jgi:hypothetical protein
MLVETGLAKLIELLKDVWQHVKPYAAVYSWQHGALFRRGVYRRTLNPGYHFKVPILDFVIEKATVIQTMRGPTQTYGERHFKWTCKYSIANLKKFMCDITDERNYLRDTLTAHVAEFVQEEKRAQDKDDDSVNGEYWDSDEAWKKMMRRLRDEASEGGFTIHKVRVVDDTDGFSFRMFGDVGEMAELGENAE